jgi:outer membrane protein assembly factor BamB
MGTGGQVTCLAVSDGKVLWQRSMVRDFGGILPRWAYRESVLVDGDKLICTPGAPDATLVALDKLTGATLWKTDVPTELEGGGFANAGAGYASPIAINFEGQRQYVQMTAKALIGVAAADGKLLWNFRKPANSFGINCTTPLYRDGMVFATSAYNAGGGAVKLSKDASGGITATEIFFNRTLQNAHGGVVEVDGFLYLSRDPGILTCVELKTGNLLWSERQPGKGSVMSADGQLYCRAEAGAGTVYLLDAKSTGYVEHGRFDPPDRTNQSAWAHMVIANGKLYVRDQDVLLCYDVKKK